MRRSRALDDFLFFYRTFAPDHSLTGGIPLVWLDTRFKVAAIAPVVLVILAIWFFAVALRARRSPAIDDWVMAALAITVLLYYPKFLARADAHVYQPFAVAVPLLVYAVYRVVSLLENRMAQTRSGSATSRCPRATGSRLRRSWSSPWRLRAASSTPPATYRGGCRQRRTTSRFSPRLGYLSP